MAIPTCCVKCPSLTDDNPCAHVPPPCARDELHQCATSCLVLWLRHVRRCDHCQQHLTTPPYRCENVLCNRIAAAWALRRDVGRFMRATRLTPDGETMQALLETVHTILRLDFQFIMYAPPPLPTDACPTYDQRRTLRTFALLDLARDFAVKVTPLMSKPPDGVDLHCALAEAVQSLNNEAT